MNLHNFVHIYIKFMFSRYKFNDFKKHQMYSSIILYSIIVIYQFEFQPQNCKRNLYPERIENIFFDGRRNKL